MTAVECFLLEETDRARLSLRRYVSSDVRCPSRSGYHNASVAFGEAPPVWTTYPDGTRAYGPDQRLGPLRSDPRWPTHCECGYAFSPADEWQYNADLLYRRAGTGELHTLRDAPVGAMWDADWYRTFGVGPDGLSLVVRTPDGDWHVDGPSRSNGVEGPGWTRTGAPPRITVRPSILMPRYHGFLTDGRLEAC